MKTKLLLELEVDTQFGPESATILVGSLINYPAILSAKILNMETEWKASQNTFPENGNLKTLNSLPITLK